MNAGARSASSTSTARCATPASKLPERLEQHATCSRFDGPMPPEQSSYRIYVDESIHDRDGFIVTSFVFDQNSLEDVVATCLRSHGLVPGIDEFKSSSTMHNSPPLRGLRAAMKRIVVHSDLRIALLILHPSSDRS
jgi:hypothetical protein